MGRYIAGTKECPFCAETIKASANKCIHCGEHFDKGRLGLRGKTVWDGVVLLIIPLTLAFAAAGLSMCQGTRDANRDATRVVELNEREDAREAIQDEREVIRVAVQAEIQSTTEANRANANSLQSYLDDISEILLSGELDLADEPTQAHAVARARTVTILSELDSKRNNTVLRFLRDSEMISWVLVDADLSGADLSGANLSGANLSGADLSRAYLGEADLLEAYLLEADLNWAYLGEANLSGANLSGADLSRANLSEAIYSAGTIWPNNFDPKSAGAILVDDEGNPIEDSK